MCAVHNSGVVESFLLILLFTLRIEIKDNCVTSVFFNCIVNDYLGDLESRVDKTHYLGNLESAVDNTLEWRMEQLFELPTLHVQALIFQSFVPK